MAGVRQLDVDDLGTKTLGDGERLVEAGADARLDALLELGPRHAEADAVKAASLRDCDGLARTGARRVVGRILRDHLLQQRGIAHGERHRTDLLEGTREGDHAETRDGAVGGHQTDQAAEGRGLADRPAGVGAERPRSTTRGDHGGGTARRAAGHAREIPRVARRAVRRVLGRRAHRELVEVGLAETDEPGLVAARHDVSVLDRHEAFQDLGARGGGYVLRGQQVLVRDRHAAEGIAAARILCPGRSERALGIDVQVRVDIAVDRGDPIEVGLGQLLGGALPRPQHAHGALGGEANDIDARHLGPDRRHAEAIRGRVGCVTECLVARHAGA